MLIFFQIIAAWLLADFLSGLVHWFEDRYIDPDKFDFFSVGADNKIHHEKPTAMTESSAWKNIEYSTYIAVPLSVFLYLFDAPLRLWLGVFFSSFGNLIHRFAHTPNRQNWLAIRIMQKIGLFISNEHHDKHHRSMKKLIPKHEAGFKFCAMTNWLNPVLDFLQFWRFLEACFRLLGLKTIKEVQNA